MIQFLTILFLVISVCGGHAQNLWGTSSRGGPLGGGVIFSVGSAGDNYQVRHAFGDNHPGKWPQRSILTYANGKIYGLTMVGGAHDLGVLFEYDKTTDTYAVKFNFDGKLHGANPNGSLTLVDGKLYGSTMYGGEYSSGVLFEYDLSTGELNKFYDFDASDADQGYSPPEAMTLASNGKLYGLAFGGVNFRGIIFEVDPVSKLYTKMVDFDGINGANPQSTLVSSADGGLYGTLSEGGAFNGGTIFKYVPGSSTVTKRFDFTPVTGTAPYGKMVEANGKLYGMTTAASTFNYGSIFELDPISNSLAIVHNFQATPGHNSNSCSLTLLQNGKLLGMATALGLSSAGTIFEFNPATITFQTVYEFEKSTGLFPKGGLVELPDGKVYGVTEQGGVTNGGALFSFNPANKTYAQHFSFNSGLGRPAGNLGLFNGKIYGSVLDGGPAGLGVVYEFDTLSGAFNEIVAFNGSGNGEIPNGNLLFSDNKFYGSTRYGGIANLGTLFSLNAGPIGHAKVIDFGSTGFAEYPVGTMAQFGDKLVGMAAGTNSGVIFEFNMLSGAIKNVLSLPVEFFGAEPTGLIHGDSGGLFGVCMKGGNNQMGFIYSYANGSINSLWHFDPSNGGFPPGAPTSASGKLYGVASVGGPFGHGVIYSFNPSSNSYVVEYAFDVDSEGYTPNGVLTFSNGRFYGMTLSGGSNDLGVIFEYDPNTNEYTKLVDLSIEIGYLPIEANLLSSSSGFVTSLSNPDQKEAKVYPNPVNHVLRIEGVEGGSIELFDVTGSRIKLNSELKNFGTLLDMSGLSPGLYFVVGTTENGKKWFRVIKN